MSNRERAEGFLARLGITPEKTEHPPVHTIDEMAALGILDRGCVVKNLFLRNANGKRHFLVALMPDRSADLKCIAKALDSSRLSFGSAERLMTHLSLTQGSVSPLAVINDEAGAVEVAIDGALKNEPVIGVHPNDNTATLWLSMEDILKVMEATGHMVTWLNF